MGEGGEPEVGRRLSRAHLHAHAIAPSPPPTPIRTPRTHTPFALARVPRRFSPVLAQCNMTLQSEMCCVGQPAFRPGHIVAVDECGDARLNETLIQAQCSGTIDGETRGEPNTIKKMLEAAVEKRDPDKLDVESEVCLQPAERGPRALLSPPRAAAD